MGFITTGIDYTNPKIASCLARDGEGEPIGWDFVDNDARPFAAAIGDTAFAESTCQSPGVRIIAVRVDPLEPVTLGRAIAFISKTPATSAVLTLGQLPNAAWEPFRQAMQHFKGLKVLVPRCAPANSAPAAADAMVLPESLGLPNVVAAPCSQ